MDDIDRAQNEVERTLAEALRRRSSPGPVATGRCLYCDELVADAHRWCDTDCRGGWEREARRARR